MINPAELDLNSLPWMPLHATTGFPSLPGVYFAIDTDGVVQYIGKAVSVRERWKAHHKFEVLESLGKVKIATLFVDVVDIKDVEIACIKWFRPPLNKYQKNGEPMIGSDIRPSKYSGRPSKKSVAIDATRPIITDEGDFIRLLFPTQDHASSAVKQKYKFWSLLAVVYGKSKTCLAFPGCRENGYECSASSFNSPDPGGPNLIYEGDGNGWKYLAIRTHSRAEAEDCFKFYATTKQWGMFAKQKGYRSIRIYFGGKESDYYVLLDRFADS